MNTDDHALRKEGQGQSTAPLYVDVFSGPPVAGIGGEVVAIPYQYTIK